MNKHEISNNQPLNDMNMEEYTLFTWNDFC